MVIMLQGGAPVLPQVTMLHVTSPLQTYLHESYVCRLALLTRGKAERMLLPVSDTGDCYYPVVLCVF